MPSKDRNKSLKKGGRAQFQIDESGRCLYSTALNKPFAAQHSQLAIRGPESQAGFQQPANLHAAATSEQAGIYRAHPHELDDDWPRIRNWIWGTYAVAMLPISGIIKPGPVATAMLLPFGLTLLVVGTIVTLVGALAILSIFFDVLGCVCGKHR